MIAGQLPSLHGVTVGKRPQNVCPARSLVRLQKGGTFSATVGAAAPKTSLRWHYSDNSPGKWSNTATITP